MTLEVSLVGRFAGAVAAVALFSASLGGSASAAPLAGMGLGALDNGVQQVQWQNNHPHPGGGAPGHGGPGGVPGHGGNWVIMEGVGVTMAGIGLTMAVAGIGTTAPGCLSPSDSAFSARPRRPRPTARHPSPACAGITTILAKRLGIGIIAESKSISKAGAQAPLFLRRELTETTQSA